MTMDGKMKTWDILENIRNQVSDLRTYNCTPIQIDLHEGELHSFKHSIDQLAFLPNEPIDNQIKFMELPVRTVKGPTRVRYKEEPQ